MKEAPRDGSLEHVLARLRREHRELDERVAALHKRKYLTADEALEKRRLQKMKLMVKDRIARLSRSVPGA